MHINSVSFYDIYYEGVHHCMIFEFFLSKYFHSYAEVVLNYVTIGDAAHLRISLSVFPLCSDVSSIPNNLVVRFSDQADNALEMSRL